MHQPILPLVYRLLLWSMVLLLARTAQAQEPLLQLDHQAPAAISLTEYFAVLEDPDSQLTVADVRVLAAVAAKAAS